jgi:hypothetical protein
VRAAHSKVLEAFCEMPVYDGFWRESDLTVFVIGFEQITDIETNPLANALRNDDLKFRFYGYEFHRVGLLESITVRLDRAGRVTNAQQRGGRMNSKTPPKRNDESSIAPTLTPCF